MRFRAVSSVAILLLALVTVSPPASATCDDGTPVAVNPTSDACGGWVAVSGTGNASTTCAEERGSDLLPETGGPGGGSGCSAVSATGNADAQCDAGKNTDAMASSGSGRDVGGSGCTSMSGIGDATTECSAGGNGYAISGEGGSGGGSACASASGTGNATTQCDAGGIDSTMQSDGGEAGGSGCTSASGAGDANSDCGAGGSGSYDNAGGAGGGSGCASSSGIGAADTDCDAGGNSGDENAGGAGGGSGCTSVSGAGDADSGCTAGGNYGHVSHGGTGGGSGCTSASATGDAATDCDAGGNGYSDWGRSGGTGGGSGCASMSGTGHASAQCDAGGRAEEGEASPAAGTACAQVSRSVLINEIFYNAIGADAGEEWVELYNPHPHPVAMTGWQLWNNGTNEDQDEGVCHFQGVLAPGQYSVVYVEACDMVLANGGDDLTLVDAAGLIVDQVWWGNGGDLGPTNAAPTGEPGQSIGRCGTDHMRNPSADFRVRAEPTPENENGC